MIDDLNEVRVNPDAVTVPASWRAHMVHWLVAARMRPHAMRPIDPQWIRANMGRPHSARRVLASSTGARFGVREPRGSWPGGEWVGWPGADRSAPTVLYLHGGGFIGCSPETHSSLVGSLVRRVAGEAWVPRYRLAPEHPFPAALEDAFAAYRFLIDEQGVSPAQLVVAGDSAGGGLALSLVHLLKVRGVPRPAGVVTFSPWADLAATGASLDENSERCSMFAGDTIRRAAGFYLGGADPLDPLVSPLYGDFSDFPPLLVHASLDEVLRDDAMRVAQRAREAGATVDCRWWPRVPHVWQFFPAVLPEARESLALAAAFIRRCVAGSGAAAAAPVTIERRSPVA
jgi:acetyl esterase/lipase